MKTLLKTSIILIYAGAAASCSSSQNTESDINSVGATQAHVTNNVIDDALPEGLSWCNPEADIDAVGVREHDNEVSRWIGGLMGKSSDDFDQTVGTTCRPATPYHRAQLPNPPPARMWVGPST